MTVVIGVTGQIAAGKSEICKHLRVRHGIEIFDADREAKHIASSPHMAEAIARAFPDCAGDTAALRKIVFNDPAARASLEAMLHPPVIAEAKRRIAEAKAIIALDVPLLYQSGMDALCNIIWMAEAARPLRLARILQRPGMDAETAEKVMETQLCVKKYRARADILIDGNAPLAALYFAADAALSVSTGNALKSSPSDT